MKSATRSRKLIWSSTSSKDHHQLAIVDILAVYPSRTVQSFRATWRSHDRARIATSWLAAAKAGNQLQAQSRIAALSSWELKSGMQAVVACSKFGGNKRQIKVRMTSLALLPLAGLQLTLAFLRWHLTKKRWNNSLHRNLMKRIWAQGISSSSPRPKTSRQKR